MRPHDRLPRIIAAVAWSRAGTFGSTITAHSLHRQDSKSAKGTGNSALASGVVRLSLASLAEAGSLSSACPGAPLTRKVRERGPSPGMRPNGLQRPFGHAPPQTCSTAFACPVILQTPRGGLALRSWRPWRLGVLGVLAVIFVRLSGTSESHSNREE